jgi:streptogramin lyase
MTRLVFQVTVTLLLISAVPLSAADYALDFDGFDDLVIIPNTPWLNPSEITIECWVNFRDISINQFPVCKGGDQTSGAYRFSLPQSNSLAFSLGEYWNGYNATGTVSLGTGLWHHIAGTYDGLTMKLYSDGALVGTYQGTNIPLGNESPLYFSYNDVEGFPYYMSGQIDDVRLWNRALTEEEIRENVFAGPTGIEPNLAAYWKLDEGTGTIANDMTGHGNTGTLYNNPCWVISDLMNGIQPDLQIRTDDEMTYTGDDIYDDLGAQTKTQIAGPNVTAVYDIRVQNDRVAVDRFVVASSVGNEYWDVNYYEVSSENDVTAEIMGAGWTTPILAAGGSFELRLAVSPKPSTPNGHVLEQVVTATSVSDDSKFDGVKAGTTFSASAPPAPYGMTYTTNEDFNKGTLVGVEYQTVPNQLQLPVESTTLPFIWVPNSNEGTVSKVDTVTGKELGRYRTGPASVYGNPSRTTVDLYGNCWVGNRNSGTVVKIGLLENGQYMDRNHNGIIETSRDLDGDGEITGSEILPWASDECVIYEVILTPGSEGTYIPGQYQGTYTNDYYNPGPRGIAVDAYNNIWAGCYGSMKYYYIDGSNGQILKTIDVSSVNHTPYGAVVDESGILWSSGNDKNHVLRLNPTNDSYSTVNLGHWVYGLGLDRSGHLFVTGATNNKISRINVLTGTVDWTKDWPGNCPTGVACTDDGDVWTADRYGGTVTRGSNDGVVKATIPVGSQPAGVAVDAEGKVWMVDAASEYIYRIDPDTNTVDLSKRIVGTTHYGYSDMTGIISRTATTRIGTWSVVHNTRQFDSPWGVVSWTSSEPKGTSLKVKVRSSNNRQTWSWWEDVENYKALRLTPEGRYLQVMATFQSMQEEVMPILYDLTVNPSPCCGDLEHPYPNSDINKDCKVDLFDFAIMASEWLDCTSPSCD